MNPHISSVINKLFLLVTGLCALLAGSPAALADYTVPAKMEWWSDARFGMFIHFGSYSHFEQGEWVMNTWEYNKQDYQTQISRPFNPSSFNAATIVSLAKAAGQKYIVITAKHHEGYAMWNRTTTSFTTSDGASIYSLPGYSGFTRDILGELKAECVKQGIHFCLYYSIVDWNHPSQTWSTEPGAPGLTVMSSTAARNAYIADMKAELAELITKYDPEVMWFDGDWFTEPAYNGNALIGWWQSADGQDLYNYLIGLKPTLVINERVKRNYGLGDFENPENSMPSGPLSRPWELNATMNGWAWGYHSGLQDEASYRSVASLIQELATAVSREGNYLLNIGPDRNGNVPPLTTTRLNGVGAWMSVHGNSIYGTTRSPFTSSPSWGVCTKKSGALYCHVFNWPGTTLTVPGIANAISNIYLMNNPGTPLSYTISGGNINITVPASAPDASDSVVVIECAGVPVPAPPAPPAPLMRYRFEGNAQDSGGSGSHGTATALTYVTGRIDAQAAQFNGTSSYVSIPRSVTDDITVALWVKTTDTAGTAGAQWWSGKSLVDGEVVGGGPDWGTAIVNGKFVLGVGSNNGDTTVASSVNINNGEWHHVAATRNNTSGAMAVYVDGVLRGSGTGPTGSRTFPPSLRIGGLQPGGNFLNGTLDDVRLYNRILTASEIAQLASGQLPAPENLTATSGSEQITLSWNAVSDATDYTVQRSAASGGPYTTIASGVTATSYLDTGLVNGTTYYYVVVATNGSGVSPDSAEASATPNVKLTGAIIGSSGSWGNYGNAITNVFDGNLNTFYDAVNDTGDWAGLDLGSGAAPVVTQIKYCPRAGWATGRMVGGQFQGSNVADFSSGVVTLFTVASAPPEGTMTVQAVTNTSSFRYLRYIGPANAFCNVAEVEFDGFYAAVPSVPTNLVAASGNGSVVLSWSGSAGADIYIVKRSTTSGGSYSTIASGFTSTSYTDTGLTTGSTYYYVVSAVNTAGESAPSSEASATPLSTYQQWKLANGLLLSLPDTATPDNDGVPILVKYATGLTPGTPSVGPAVLSTVNNTLTLQFTRLSPAPVNYAIESSTGLSNELSTWTTIATLPMASNTWTGPASVAETGTGATRSTTVTDTQTMGSGPRRFLRLRVNANEIAP